MVDSRKWQELTDPGPIEKVTMFKEFLEKRVKGQSKAIDALCKIYQYELTLRWLEERKGPIGVLMFLGPSGVGKTELARVMAEYFMGSIDSLVKIDCSAFSQPHMIHSLIGAPHGYIGHDKEPPLSMAKLKSRFKNKKPVKNVEMDLIEKQKMTINIGIKNCNLKLINLEDDFKTRRTFIGGINDYHRILHGSGDGEQIVADLLKSEGTRLPIISMLHPDSVAILDNDITNPAEDAAILLGLNSELKQIYCAYKETEILREKLRGELESINKKKATINTQVGLGESQEGNKEPEPRLVILFDEIEKANTTLHQLLLQVMEEGQLTLANGTVTDLRNAFVVLTSNVGSASIGDMLKKRGIGFSSSMSDGKMTTSTNKSDSQELERRILAIAEREMEKTFQPEFRRRIDDVIVFRSLSQKIFYEILDYQIELFSQALNITGIDLVVDPEVKDIIVGQSLHRPEVGASLLDHKFKSLVKIPLGQRLSGKDIKGTVVVYADPIGKIRFSLGDW